MKALTPLWTIKPKELTRWKKSGVFMFSRSVCQIVLMSYDDPIGIMMLKPVRISRENKIIIGTFCLNEFDRANAKKERRLFQPFYISAPYHRKAQAFVWSVNPEYLDLIFSHPDVDYVDNLDRRETIKSRLSEDAYYHEETSA